MKGDFTRQTFRPKRHYSGVRMQQGRVQLDADWNEQVDIGAHRDRATTRDVVGPAGAPDLGDGFEILPAALLTGLDFSGQQGVAVGERGTILRTADGGTTWTAAAPPQAVANEHLRAIDVASATHAWAMGTGGTVLATTNSGAAWTAQAISNPQVTLHGVHFLDQSTGFAVGADGRAVRTTNGGTAWANMAMPGGLTQTLRAVSFADANLGCAVGDAGRIARTANGGSAWSLAGVPAGLTATLRGVSLSGQNGVAVGDGATILTTTNGGQSWTRREPPGGVTATLRSVHHESATAVWAVGDDATVLRSTNGGGTWAVVPPAPELAADLFAVRARGAGAAAVAGDISSLARVTAGNPPGWTLAAAPQATRNLALSPGHLYVDGILCESERAVRLTAQADLPGEPLPTAPGRYVAYVEVWQRHVTSVERDELREIALGGPDTATRTQTVWQARLEAATAGAECEDFAPPWAPDPASTGRMRARSAPAQDPQTDCMVPASGGFRRLENQLYRIEVLDGSGGGSPTFTWSRDNGAATSRLVDTDPAAKTVTVADPGRDAVTGLSGAAWIELTDEERTLKGERGVLLEVDNVIGETIAVKTAPPATSTFGPGATVRRWESRDALQANGWRPLAKEGIEVQFAPGTYAPGEYWTIPARTVDAAIEWEAEDGISLFERPEGPERRYCALAVVDLAADGTWTVVSDCRPLFAPLTGMVRAYPAGGDGQEVMPEPGDQLHKLPEPLEVAVMNGRQRVQGAKIQFAVVAGNGAVTTPPGAAASTEVETGADGVARCDWWLRTGPGPHRVEATLLQDAPLPQHAPMHFNANLSVAGAVAYDPAACAELAGVKTVQQAIDHLCVRNGAGTCTLEVHPGESLKDALAHLPAGGGEVCIAAGTYELDETVTVEGRDRIVVVGRGPSTVIRVHGSEAAIAFAGCRDIAVRDLRIESDRAVADTRKHLNGALTFLGCSSAEVRNCQLVCPDAPDRTQTCLTVRPFEREGGVLPPGRIVAEGNRLWAGALQSGMLVVDADRIEIRHNEVALGEPGQGPGMPGSVLRREIPLLMLAALTEGPEPGTRRIFLGEPDAGVLVEPLAVDVRIGEAGEALWQLYADNFDPITTPHGDLVRGVDNFAAALLAGVFAGGAAVLLQADRALRAVGQGIVVGGSRANEVRIADNRVSAIQGIHVAPSHADQPGTERAGRVLLSRNFVQCVLPLGWTRERHAVFVGSSDSITVETTGIDLIRLGNVPLGPPEWTIKPLHVAVQPLELVRIWGEWGYLNVRGTSIRALDTGLRSYTGIRVEPSINVPFEPPEQLWLVADTYAESNHGYFEFFPTAVVAPASVEQERNYA